MTDKPFDTNGPPGIAAISEDCVSDGAAQVDFGSTPPPPKPKPQPKRCDCKGVDVTTRNVSIGQLSWALTLDWTLTCTGDAGGKCQGEIKGFGWAGNPGARVTGPKPPKAKKGQPPNPVEVTCKEDVPFAVEFRAALHD